MIHTKIRNKTSGITTGMGIFQYFVSLFVSNELLPDKQKMTDLTIAKKIAREYPHLSSAQDFLYNKSKKTINSYRGRYNLGKFCPGNKGIPPVKMSMRYDDKGQIVNFKTGRVVLSKEEIVIIRKNHKDRREIILRRLL